jgi:hypothetical protein
MPRERGETIFQDATAPAVVAAVPALNTDARVGRFTASALSVPVAGHRADAHVLTTT